MPYKDHKTAVVKVFVSPYVAPRFTGSLFHTLNVSMYVVQLGGDLEFIAGGFSPDKKKTALALVRDIQVGAAVLLYTQNMFNNVSVMHLLSLSRRFRDMKLVQKAGIHI